MFFEICVLRLRHPQEKKQVVKVIIQKTAPSLTPIAKAVKSARTSSDCFLATAAVLLVRRCFQQAQPISTPAVILQATSSPGLVLCYISATALYACSRSNVAIFLGFFFSIKSSKASVMCLFRYRSSQITQAQLTLLVISTRRPLATGSKSGPQNRSRIA